MRKRFVVIGIAFMSASTLCGYSFPDKTCSAANEVTVEFGEQAEQELLQFAINEQITAKSLVTDMKAQGQVTVTFSDGTETKSYSAAGTYTETLTLTDGTGSTSSLEVTFEVVADATKPVLKGLKNRTVYVGSTIDYLKNVTATDNVDGDLTSKIQVDSSNVNLEKAGKYIVVYTVTDSAGNTTTKKKTVTVKKDEKPVIKGVKRRTVYVGGTIDYLKGVTAVDKRDGDLTSKIVVDSSSVDLTKAGTYKVTYTVTDSSDNKTVKTAKVIVKEKKTTSAQKSTNSSATKKTTKITAKTTTKTSTKTSSETTTSSK